MTVIPLNAVTAVDPPPRWAAQATAFLRAKRADVGIKPATYRSYSDHLIGPRAVEWLIRNGINDVSDLTVSHVRDRRLTLMEAGLKENSVRSAATVLKTFARWCDDEGWVVDPKVCKMKGSTPSVVAPEIFTDAQLAKLFAKATNPRDAFLMEFLLGTGLRLSEAMGVRLGDIVEGPDGTVVHVRASEGHAGGKGKGEGGKDRIVPMDTPKHRLSRKLNTYVRSVRPRDTEREELFLSSVKPRGKDWVPLTPDAVKQMLSRLGDEAGVPHTHAHRFRHTFATRAIAAGVNVLALQRALGHTTLAMTQKYVQFDHTSILAEWSHRRD